MRFYAIEGIQIKIKDMKIKWNKETEPNFEDIKIGDKFAERDDEDEVFTVVDVFVKLLILMILMMVSFLIGLNL